MARDPIRDAKRRLSHKVDVEIGKVRSGCFITIFMTVIAVVILLIGAFFLWRAYEDGAFSNMGRGGTAGDSGAEEVSWDGKTPLVCKGNDEMRVSGVEAKLDGVIVVQAKGNCTLTLDDVVISGRVGIESGGNSTVTVNSGSVTGTEFLVDAQGLSTVTFAAGVETSGEVKSAGGATVNAPQ